MKSKIFFLLLASPALVIAQTKPMQNSNANAPSAKSSVPKIQPFNIKTGLWKTSTTISVAGGMPISPAMLARLTPEQRARIEQAMKKSSGNNQTRTEQHCVTKEKLADPINTTNKECKWNIAESTSNKAKGSVSCESQGVTMNGEGEFESPDSEHMNGWTHGTTSGGDQSMTVDTKISSKWLGANCGDVQ
jgi:hypothetical protein